MAFIPREACLLSAGVCKRSASRNPKQIVAIWDKQAESAQASGSVVDHVKEKVSGRTLLSEQEIKRTPGNKVRQGSQEAKTTAPKV